MRYIALIVEQLHRAALELAIDHPINNRIALILIDNAAELVVHHRLARRRFKRGSRPKGAGYIAPNYRFTRIRPSRVETRTRLAPLRGKTMPWKTFLKAHWGR